MPATFQPGPDPFQEEEPRPRGRPSIGTAVEVTLPDDVLVAVDLRAARAGKKRSALLREIVESWVMRQP